MNGQQLIDLIQDNQLEAFEVVVNLFEPAPGEEWGISLRTFTIDPELTDIGYSDKKAILKIVEQ